ncbi:putative DNA-binding transcriptional regulator YafY [Aquimarina sp. EL_43]|uniref:helix-turn-helix transcriptional regulator n=1 Tax=unclassified Aquimarina TaxID=2627091 RepID=UPI0018C97F87|nr:MULTISPECIES: YafY family protein [unclassified Aquimarina]MBG6130657.1 putative DNA-binding transcriptional regulator YafY [Aquimarina sp. EL_35]MBG6151197.1 putative DNA-binding transcriptional regulator YafY [Aquimarina sp. EL_32]MBG6169059.1 putative DNA-binding transcriptional regulator YafY [Aquimarina sp. EL_43]
MKKNRLTRITSILTQLQSKKVITAKEIANRFEISLRTVYRDIKTLQDAGVPIGSENGIGYFLVDGYSLPPIMITEEEANAILVAEKFIQNQGDTSLIKDFTSLLIKIKSVLRNTEKENIDKLENRIVPSYLKKTIKSNWLSIVQKAIANTIVLEVIYHSLYKDEKTKRDIEPLGLYFTDDKVWVTIAHCRLRNEIREFRLDRIENITSNGKTFKYQHNFDLQEYFINVS